MNFTAGSNSVFDRGYEKVEHYSNSKELDQNLEVELKVFSVYRDAEGDLEEDFQMIKYSFNRDITKGAEEFRQKADEFSDYDFFPITGEYSPENMTVMVNSSGRIDVANFAEELVEDVHSEIGL